MAKKKATKMKAKRVAMKAKAKPAKKSMSAKRKAARKSSSKKMANRRKYRRIQTSNLWVTEHMGEYRFVVSVIDISEGGVFLKSRLKTGTATSQLLIPMTDGGSIELAAKPIHDRIGSDGYGAGYQFVDMSSAQTKALRGLLRNLD